MKRQPSKSVLLELACVWFFSLGYARERIIELLVHVQLSRFSDFDLIKYGAGKI